AAGAVAADPRKWRADEGNLRRSGRGDPGRHPPRGAQGEHRHRHRAGDDRRDTQVLPREPVEVRSSRVPEAGDAGREGDLRRALPAVRLRRQGLADQAGAAAEDGGPLQERRAAADRELAARATRRGAPCAAWGSTGNCESTLEADNSAMDVRRRPMRPRRRAAHQVAIIATTAAAIVPVASQPSAFNARVTVNAPMTLGSSASSIITTMIGTAMTPLITAAQNSARIGSIGEKSSATPPSVASAMIA